MQTNEMCRKSCPILLANFLHVRNSNYYLVCIALETFSTGQENKIAVPHAGLDQVMSLLQRSCLTVYIYKNKTEQRSSKAICVYLCMCERLCVCASAQISDSVKFVCVIMHIVPWL